MDPIKRKRGRPRKPVKVVTEPPLNCTLKQFVGDPPQIIYVGRTIGKVFFSEVSKTHGENPCDLRHFQA